AIAAEALAAAVLDRRGESRPEAAGLSRRRAAALSRGARRTLPHRRAGHVQRRQARDSRRRHDVLAVLTIAARRALSRRGRARRDEDRAGSSSRRPRRHVLPEYLPRRPAEEDA